MDKLINPRPELTNLYGCSFGKNCKVGAFCEIGEGVEIGNNVNIQAFVYVPSGVEIGDNVFIGPRVTFTNVKRPDSLKKVEKYELITYVCDGAVIGAGAIILPGVDIGNNATIGAGAVVTKSVRPGATVVGNPAREI